MPGRGQCSPNQHQTMMLGQYTMYGSQCALESGVTLSTINELRRFEEIGSPHTSSSHHRQEP
jgi:hypothetical protein